MAKKKKEPEIKNNYNDFIIAVDISLTDSGVAVYSLSEGKIVHIDHCDTSEVRALKKYKGYNLNAIKLNIQRDFFESIKKKFPPSIVVFERSFTKFKKETEAINQINGVIYSVFWNYTQVKYPNTTVKAEIVHGKADKEMLRDVILENVPELRGDDLFYNNDNVSDAVAVLYTHLFRTGLYKKVNWDKKDYVKKVPKKKKIIQNKNTPY